MKKRIFRYLSDPISVLQCLLNASLGEVLDLISFFYADANSPYGLEVTHRRKMLLSLPHYKILPIFPRDELNNTYIEILLPSHRVRFLQRCIRTFDTDYMGRYTTHNFKGLVYYHHSHYPDDDLKKLVTLIEDYDCDPYDCFSEA